MPATNYSDLVAYFEGLPVSVTTIKGVTVGDDEAIESLQNSVINYPHLWVETPEIMFVGTDDNPASRFNFNIAVLVQATVSDRSAENTALNTAYNILTAIYARLLADSDAGEFDLVLKDYNSDPIRKWSNDNLFGWRTQITLEIYRNEC